MIYKLFAFAYPQEAQPFIELFSPKHLFQLKTIQCLYAEKHQIYFLITGSGSINTSVALTAFFERNSGLKDNILCFNIGIAGSRNKQLYTVYLASKISNYHTFQSFYPDIFVKTNYAELITIQFPADKKIMAVYPNAMFDMEGFAYAYTLKFYVQNHQIHCIKFISDNDGSIKNPEELLQVYFCQASTILQIINSITATYTKFFSSKNIIPAELYTFIENLPFTFSQKIQLKDAALFYLKNNHTISDIYSHFQKYKWNDIKIKKDRNILFEKMIKELYRV